MVDPLPAKRMYILFRTGEKPPVTVSLDLEKIFHMKQDRKDCYITYAYRICDGHIPPLENAGYCVYYPEYHDKYMTGSYVNKLHDELLQQALDIRKGLIQLTLT